MQLQTMADEMHSVQISDPFAKLEDEDRNEVLHWKQENTDLKQQALRRDEAKKLTKKLVAQMHGGQNHISSIWRDLEIQDRSIQERIDELDDPRQPLDLQKYELLNHLQDDSMNLLENRLEHASLRQLRRRQHHQ